MEAEGSTSRGKSRPPTAKRGLKKEAEEAQGGETAKWEDHQRQKKGPIVKYPFKLARTLLSDERSGRLESTPDDFLQHRRTTHSDSGLTKVTLQLRA